MTEDTSSTDIIEIAAELTAAWLANPNTRASADDALAFFKSMQGAITPMASADAAEVGGTPIYEPVVSVRKSLASRDHIISLIDGKPYRTLRRHLSTHGLTPDQYRERYNLKVDYPMVAPTYSETRRAMAKKIGLGRKPGQTLKSKTK
ncbi:MAG: MucR family transcriptional regulator [Sphingomonas sp.]|uniref:MucR family transcriptional regulator n=1 Tax=Sphingomonas sp. TaxID=28214 RepID=UPI001ACEF93C|nr:MucR family transcriptional regulator [Sphingomonas sp.]MBN8808394.1 MucR family transcriptional regulator [Sphingomonas sp.]